MARQQLTYLNSLSDMLQGERYQGYRGPASHLVAIVVYDDTEPQEEEEEEGEVIHCM